VSSLVAPDHQPVVAGLSHQAAAPGRERSARDFRLDFFRGLAMLIILIAHIPDNPWAQFIPARFGPSDAAEMFVFCSGYAAGIALGGVFVRHGWWLGTCRILLRFWQIYWAHLAVFILIAAILAAANRLAIGGQDHIGALNLHPFFADPQTQLVGLVTLTYVPNYFDILPMYMVVLLFIPVVMALQRIHLAAAAAFSLALYATARAGLNLPAEPWSDRPWFFNPFAWQLLFFTGFAIARNWLAVPPFRPWLLGLAAGYVLAMIPLAHDALWPATALTRALHEAIWGGPFDPAFKTNMHPVRLLHLLALGYLAIWLCARVPGLLRSRLAQPVIRVGQQALATFVGSITVAQLAGITLAITGRNALTVAIVNLAGLTSVVALAYLVSWYKREPWRRP
jgi:hypothetical protein